MRILLVHQGLQSFVQKDLDILSSGHEVRDIHFVDRRDVPSVWRGVAWCDVTFSWFGKLHGFFAVLFSKLLGKKAVVVAGGDDVAREPQFNYGAFSYWWKKWCPLIVFRYANLTLCVSQFNRSETIQNTRARPAKVRTLHHGFDPQRFSPIQGVAKDRVVITVGGVDWERLERKGYERFVRSATHLPQVHFALIGQWHDDAIDHLREVASNNVSFTGRVSDDELLQWFRRARVYVQASLHEAFGCSLAEAMLCECVPVVSRRAALPEVVGDCGFYVDQLTPEGVAAEIEKALVSDLAEKARARIMREFPLEKRREGLLAAVDEVISS